MAYAPIYISGLPISPNEPPPKNIWVKWDKSVYLKFVKLTNLKKGGKK